MRTRDELYESLKGKWQIQSVDSDVTGYWTKDDDLIDLTELQLNIGSAEEYQAYLDSEGLSAKIRITASECFYELESLEIDRMTLALFFKNKHLAVPLKLCTFKLRKQ